MSKKNRKNIVYSTNPDYEYDYEDSGELDTLPVDEQQLVVSLDKKQRKGKVVTLVQGFVGSSDDLNELGKLLKRHCGVGGNAKDGEVIIQGDNKEKVCKFLESKGYNVKKR